MNRIMIFTNFLKKLQAMQSLRKNNRNISSLGIHFSFAFLYKSKIEEEKYTITNTYIHTQLTLTHEIHIMENNL